MAQNYFIVRNGLQIGNTQVINSSGAWIGPTIGSAGIWSSISSNTTANSGYNYIANTATGSFVLTLPTSPSTGNNVTIVDGYNWSTNNLIVYPNGSTIENTSGNLILNMANTETAFVYDGSTWHLYSNSGPAGATGLTGASGVIGLTGATGVQGIQGASGATGTYGASGVGASGVQGASGSTGPQGFQGASGPNGGYLTPGTYVARGILAAGQTILTATNTIIQMVDDFDPNGWLTTYQFKPNVAGYYQVNATITGPSSGTYCAISIYKNGSLAYTGTTSAGNFAGNGTTISCLISMNGSTDYVEFFMYQASGGTTTTSANNYSAYIQGAFIRSA